MTPSVARGDPPDGWSVSLHGGGRAGELVYEEAGRSMLIPWEMSGVERYDLLLAPMRLSQWTHPVDAPPLPVPQQLRILHNLRAWLEARSYRTDLSRPIGYGQERCRVVGCYERSLAGSMLCGRHFDLDLLGQLFPSPRPEG